MELKIVSPEELQEILEQHKLWLETRFDDEVKGKRADLSATNLYNANLENANLYNANLRYANLRYANLENANLENANLRYANLRYANLENANLDDKEEIRKGYILNEDLIAYKKCRDDKIVELNIPKGSIVFSINNDKCRTNRAKVVSITSLDESKNYRCANSQQDINFVYNVGDELEIDDFCLMYNVECASGIHFFRTRKEAVDY